MSIKINLVLLLVLLAVVPVLAQRTHNGIGVRLGEPLGITYKIYLSSNRALEFGIGSASNTWDRNYYKNSFGHYGRYDDYNYTSHRVKSLFYLQARYLIHRDIDIEGLEGKLQWYWGVGALLKSANVQYRYKQRVAPYAEATDTYQDIDFGPEGILGLEYTFEDVPVSIFGEFSLMLEFADRPGTFRTFSGVGVRYNF